MDLIVPYNNIENISSIRYATNIPQVYATWNSGIIYGKSTDKNPIIVRLNGKLYKSLITYNYTNPSTNSTAWKYIADEQYPTAVKWDTATAYNLGDIVYTDGFYFKALIANTGNTPASLPTNNTYWEFIGYTNSHSLIQNTAVGNTKLFSGGSIVKLDKLKENNHISFLGLKNVKSIDIIEKYRYGVVGVTSANPFESASIDWKGVEYSESLNLLVYVGNRLSDNKLIIRYISNFSQQSVSLNQLIQNGPFTTIEIDSQLYETGDYSPTIANKIYWSDLFSSFYIIGSTAAGYLNILKSQDGINWTSCQLGTWNQTGNLAVKQISTTPGTGMVDIIDAGHRLLAASKYGIWSSIDGKNWIETLQQGDSTTSFHNIAYVPQSSNQTGFLCAVGDKNVAGSGNIWAFARASDGSDYLIREYTIVRSHKLSTLYNSKTDELLVGGTSGILKYITNASKKTVANFTNNVVTWTDYALGNATCIVLMKPSIEYGVVFISTDTQLGGINPLTILYTTNRTNGSIIDGVTTFFSDYSSNTISPKTLITISRTGNWMCLVKSTRIIHDDILTINKTNYNVIGQNTLSISNTFLTTNDSKLYIYFDLENGVDYGEVSNVIVGVREILGITQANMSVGITDYSKKDTDEFGNVVFIERPYSQRINTNLVIPDTQIYKTYERLVSLRTTPCIWIGVSNDTTYNFLTVLGFYKEFSVDINYPEYSFCSLSIESLANL